ncbi:MAG: response regulator, partial [Pirellulaceae bacterium]|nr:response regulator [Pirellulaceae bacterium]
MSPPANILVVEDERHLAVGIKYNLEAEGFRVSTAADGPTALRLLEEEAFDLVVLDIMLPGMSGYAVCKSIRDQGSDVPVLILSARTLSEDRTRGFDVGANQYLSKPFDLDELLSRVRNLLNH